MRKLASVQVINALDPIPNADKIEKATVLGWECVVKKGDFKVGDKCVYFEIDSLLPEDNPVFDFLKDSKGHIKRLQTKKLRGQISQGLCMPMSILEKDAPVGTDVTAVLKVKKWEPDAYNRPRKGTWNQRDVKRFHGWFAKKVLYGKPWTNWFKRFLFTASKKSFPPFIYKTDETRVQNLPDVIEKYAGTSCIVTEKLDGQSYTLWFDDQLKMHVASRNLEILDTNNYFWQTAKRMDLEAKLKNYFADDLEKLKWLCLQGEQIGPNIQGNKYKFTQKCIYWFNMLYVRPVRYLDFSVLEELVLACDLKTVPVVERSYKLENDVHALIEKSKGQSALGHTPREGIVIRPEPHIIDNELHDMVGNRVSFKAINPDFLLKYE